MDARGSKLAETSKQLRESALEQAAWGWDASPISTARLSAEMWNLVKDEDWSLVSDTSFISNWPLKLWDFTKHYQFIGWSGGYGIGYGAPAAVGAALANRKHGRLSINIQCDGDMNYAPAVLWTAAHHRIPLLTVMHNNRAYHQERMYITDDGRPRESRRQPRPHRQRARGSVHRLRVAREGLRRPRTGSDPESQRSRARAETGH